MICILTIIIAVVSWVITIVYGVRQRTLNKSLFGESSTILTRLENFLKEANETKIPSGLISRIDEIRSFTASFNHTVYLTQKPFWRRKGNKSQG